MALSRLLIRDFHNIASADLSLSADFNFLVGANGSGKTSVLEAIYTLGHGRAFRSLQSGRGWLFAMSSRNSCYMGVLIPDKLDARATSVGLSRNCLDDSMVRIGGSDGHKVAELAQFLPMQLITLEGFTLLNGGLKYQRAFMDWDDCFHNEPGFFTACSNLPRLLKQRNAALRQVSRYQQSCAHGIRS